MRLLTSEFNTRQSFDEFQAPNSLSPLLIQGFSILSLVALTRSSPGLLTATMVMDPPRNLQGAFAGSKSLKKSNESSAIFLRSPLLPPWERSTTKFESKKTRDYNRTSIIAIKVCCYNTGIHDFRESETYVEVNRGR